jgi:integrase/recombinase XerD
MPTKDSKKTTLPKTNRTNVESISTTTISLSKDPRQFKLEAEASTLVESYKQFLIANSKAATTIKSYIFDIKSFVEFIETVEKQVFTGQFNEDQYKHYIKSQTEANHQIATLNKRINSIASFNNYLIEMHLMTTNVANLKTDKITIAQPEEATIESNSNFPQKLNKII